MYITAQDPRLTKPCLSCNSAICTPIILAGSVAVAMQYPSARFIGYPCRVQWHSFVYCSDFHLRTAVMWWYDYGNSKCS